jgi:hypothetical protein
MARLALPPPPDSLLVTLVAGVVSIIALFRAGSFIHELTHIKKGELARIQAWLEFDHRHPAAHPVLPL